MEYRFDTEEMYITMYMSANAARRCTTRQWRTVPLVIELLFSNPENAASELRLVLPAPLSAAIEWSTLELCPGSFVDPRLSQQHTDLLFKVRYAGHDAHLYVLFEHQSTEDSLMPSRILQ